MNTTHTHSSNPAPDDPDTSLFASVKLALAQLSPTNRERANALGVFHGGADLNVLQLMMEWEQDQVASLVGELLQNDLATRAAHSHIRLHPALCPYLRSALDADRRADLEARWSRAMRAFIGFLDQWQSQDAQLATTLIELEIPNAMALLDRFQADGDTEAIIDLTTPLSRLVQHLDQPNILAKITVAQQAAAHALDATAWSRARFEVQSTQVEQQLASDQLSAAVTTARHLHQQALSAGEAAYPKADNDIAGACWLLGHVLGRSGAPAEALPLLREAQNRFETITTGRHGRTATGMACAALSEQGDCLRATGRLDEAATAYEEAIRLHENSEDPRGAAVGKGQLGTVRLLQQRYDDALQAHQEARDIFAALGEPRNVAVAWNQIGRIHEQADQPDDAEQAYRQALEIEIREDNVEGQADALFQLGNLYDGVLGRPEEAVVSFRQAAEKRVLLEDRAGEGRTRNRLADALCKLGRRDEARGEIRRALACAESSGHDTEPWKTWSVLHNIEQTEGNAPAAAEARAKVLGLYLAYRRDGGENHSNAGRLCRIVTAALLGQSPEAPSVEDLKSQLGQLLTTDSTWDPLIPLLLQIVDGGRDRPSAENSGLRYDEAAEIHILLDQLESTGN